MYLNYKNSESNPVIYVIVPNNGGWDFLVNIIGYQIGLKIVLSLIGYM